MRCSRRLQDVRQACWRDLLEQTIDEMQNKGLCGSYHQVGIPIGVGHWGEQRRGDEEEWRILGEGGGKASSLQRQDEMVENCGGGRGSRVESKVYRRYLIRDGIVVSR